MPGYYEHYHDTVHWHMADITSRIIAESGIPSDRFHLGKILLQSLKDSPDIMAQIEGSTGETETNNSLMQRTIQCAVALKKLGFQSGDVMILMAPNHLDLAVPLYAGLYLGIIVAPIDMCLGIKELTDIFNVTTPKLVFFQNEKVDDIREAMKGLEVKTHVITFDKGDGDMDFSKLLELGKDSGEIEKFRCTDFDPAETIAMLVSTSGTTGLPKQAAATHKNFVLMGPYLWSKTVEIPTFDRSLVLAPLQWLSAVFSYINAPIMKFTRIQSSQNSTQEHVYELINKYRPAFMIISPTMLTTLMRPGDRDQCDFNCFERIFVGGSVVSTNLLKVLAEVMPKTDVLPVYGMSELTNISFTHGFSSPRNSCGKPMGCLQYRLVDVKTKKDINEPNVTGELWLKGPGFFKGYYNNPEMTKEAFEGEWVKSGDLFYRDENWNFYFVERLKLLLKYKNHQISPVEVEAVIQQHPGVSDVAVGGIPDEECGELPVAFVVRAPGQTPSEQEIKDFVKESLSDTKQLRGGVIFLDQLPLTATTKLHRRKIKEMAIALKKY